MVLENLVNGVKYVAGGIALGSALLFGGGCERDDQTIDVPTELEASNFTATPGNYENTLSWDNPDTEGPFGVMVRRNQNTFPTDATDGTLVYEGQDESYVDRGIEADILYCYKLFLLSYTDPIGPSSGLEASATPFDGIAPGLVTGLTATPQSLAVSLTWTNPSDSDLAGVMIRRKTGFFPISPTDGTLVYDFSGQSCLDASLTVDVLYYYSVFTYDEVPNYSTAAIVTGTPIDGMPPGNAGGFTLTPGLVTMSLSWYNPSDPDFTGVVIRRKINSTPTGPSDGDLIFMGNGISAQDTSINLTHSADDDTYHYAIYAYDEVPNYATGVSASHTVDGVKAIGWIGDGSNGWKTGSGATAATDYQSFFMPFRVTLDSGGNMYVTDGVGRVCKWDASGNAVGWIGEGSNGWKQTSASTSSGDYRAFMAPKGMFVDSSGTIYVADGTNHRISKWAGSGTAIGWIGGGSNGWKQTWGSNSANDYQSFNSVYGVYLDSSGNIYVADRENHRICKWSSSGNAIGWIGGGSNGWKQSSGATAGSDYQSFDKPYDVCLDSSGNIYVLERSNNRVSKWDSNGNAQGWIGAGYTGWQTSNALGSGSAYDRFNNPRALFVRNGYIYVGDQWNHRISKWTTSGNPVGTLGSMGPGWEASSGGGSAGSDYQSLNVPVGIFVTSSKTIYIVDTGNDRVCKWQD